MYTQKLYNLKMIIFLFLLFFYYVGKIEKSQRVNLALATAARHLLAARRGAKHTTPRSESPIL
jgi:hypothetical protein